MKRDYALIFPNPRLLAAVYFGLLSVVGTTLINGLLTLLGVKESVPLYHTIVVGMVIASLTGALFGKEIIHCPHPYKAKTFWIGFVMVLASLPFFTLGLLLGLINEPDQPLFSITNFRDFASLYVFALAYSYVIFGFLLAIAAGLAAMYLRGHLVYDILHTDTRRSQRLPQFAGARHKARPLSKAPAAARKRM
jgi:hypothetical protein